MYLRPRHIACALDLVQISTQENFDMEAPVKTATFGGGGGGRGKSLLNGMLER
jgi:hypothetical protein